MTLHKFYDAATPAHIPTGADACVYIDGLYKATVEETKRFNRTRWITVLGNYEHAGIADYEQGNEVFSKPGELRKWCEGRRQMNCKARVYAGRNNLPAAYRAVGDMPNVYWWIPTLDGELRSLEELVGMVEEAAAIEAGKVWGCQYAGGMHAKYDTSVLYGAW